MRCVECKHFRRFDMRSSPPAVVCCCQHDGDTDHNRGCGHGELKDSKAQVWKQGGGLGEWYSQARRACA